MKPKRTVIRAEQLYTGKKLLTDQTIVIEEDRIVEVTGRSCKAAYSGVVTPAFIDAHSHIGMERQGEPAAESETDDRQTTFAPLHNPVNSIYFDDRAFEEAVDFGVLYSCVVPGSGNILGGQAMLIKNFSQTCKDAVIGHYGYKMALGFNPRSDSRRKGQQHNTRMGNAAFLEKQFEEVTRQEAKARVKRDRSLWDLDKGPGSAKQSTQERLKKKSWIKTEYEHALSSEQWAVFGMLNGQKPIKVHVHKEDDALFLVDLKKRFGLAVTAEHTCGVRSTEVFNELADNGIPIVYGPLASLDYKVELKTASYKNVGSLLASRAQFGLMTDHPVILAHHLRDSLKYFLIAGMAPETAVGLVTHENAKILGLDDRIGEIKPGMLASLVVWNKDLFHLSAFPSLVVAEGKIVRGGPEAIV